MPKTTAFANSILKLIFQAVPIANLADNAVTGPLTNLYWALHTADPGLTGDQTTSEIAYTGYARQAVARSAGGFTVTNNSCSPAANVVFPVSTAGTPTATHASIGSAVSGAGVRYVSGTVAPAIVVSLTVPQTIVSSSAITEA